MKEHLLAIKREQGYFLPFVLFCTIILLSSILTTIAIYKNDLLISDQLFEQLKSETIVQMSVKQFLSDEVIHNKKTGQATYQFPNGEAVINYENMGNNHYLLAITINTDRGKTFTIQRKIKIP